MTIMQARHASCVFAQIAVRNLLGLQGSGRQLWEHRGPTRAVLAGAPAGKPHLAHAIGVEPGQAKFDALTMLHATLHLARGCACFVAAP